MKLFLAGLTSFLDRPLVREHIEQCYVLESFFYANKKTERYIPIMKDFLLDSGAFTFFSGSSKSVKWEEYVDKYADFIIRNNVKNFFELDIDKVVGYDNVLRLRKRLELKTGKKCIPVWHKSRGKDDFLRMCDDYSYVAIGGIVSKEIKSSEYDVFYYLLNEAHKRSCKVHGLGFTNLEGIKKYNFDTVDSTSWISGNKFGAVYKFNGNTMVKRGKEKGERLKGYNNVLLNNFNEWKKFQQYVDMVL